MKIKIKKLHEDAVIPVKGSDYAAGYDLYAINDEVIYPHNTTKVSTGLAIEIPEGYFGGVFARSGLASKKGLRPANCVGVIDSDYRGEIIVLLHNDTDTYQLVNKGDRIAQLVIMPYLSVEFEEAENLNDTERGDGGFGSTGK
ncbi:MAG: dUTP diphosphatase [Bacillota bacterium]|jgi:dUTP pyrophosphatase|nr:dUTP diphosphatase [Bacillota bacterium]NLL26236.1 dUTP diphosphatase [Erysipelotrichia bacterium]